MTHEDNLSYHELYAALMKRINELSNDNTDINTESNNNNNTTQNQTDDQQSVEAKKNPLGERIEDEETEVIIKAETYDTIQCIMSISMADHFVDLVQNGAPNRCHSCT